MKSAAFQAVNAADVSNQTVCAGKIRHGYEHVIFDNLMVCEDVIELLGQIIAFQY